MSRKRPRLDQERQAKLEPIRMEGCIAKLTELGKYVENDDKSLWFVHNKEMVTYWPYSGWASGKSIKDGRGFENLLKQLK